jgi:NhaA family Na+:H+ antiporter
MAIKPGQYSWRQLVGAGMLGGIGFTMSLFIAGQAFPVAQDFAAAKIAVFAASGVAAIFGVLMLWGASPSATSRSAAPVLPANVADL